MSALICGSLAYDTIMVFQDQFKKHILPDQVHILNVSFLVPAMRREFGGCAGNIAYNLKLLGGDPIPMATVGADFGPYRAWFEEHGIALGHVKVIEELFTNTVRHGYQGECDHPVWLHALPAPGALCLTYQDAAAAFDPLALELHAEAAAPQCIGGQGIRLIRSLTSSVAYRRADDRNILTLVFTVAPH